MSYWLLPSNDKHYDALAALGELKTVTWQFTYNRHNLKEGDTVYLYSGKPKQCLTAVLRVASLPGTEISDEQFFQSESPIAKHKSAVKMSVDLELADFVPLSAKADLTLSAIMNFGLKGAPQSLHELDTETCEYIESVLNSARQNSDVAAEGFPADQELLEKFSSQIKSADFAVEDAYTSSKTRGSAQQVFAREVKKNYGYRCAITGISTANFLVASHIVPWSTDSEIRLDPANGICLSVLVDKAFENGALTIGDDLSVAIDESLADSDPILYTHLRDYEGRVLTMPSNGEPKIEYLVRRRQINQLA